MSRRPSDLELVVSLMRPPTPEYLSEPIKEVFREESRKNLLQAEKELPTAIRNCELFNFRCIKSNSIITPGVRGILTLKDYPNIWAEFQYTTKYITSSIEFKCYIKEDRWQKFNIPFSIFKQAIGWQSRHETVGLLRKIFGGEKPDCKCNIEYIRRCISYAVEHIGVELIPGKFYVGKGISDINWDINQAREYSKSKECVCYELDTNNELKATKIKLDKEQQMLLQLFIEPNKDL